MSDSLIILLLTVVILVLIYIVYLIYNQPAKISTKETDLAEVMPIQFINENAIVNENLTFGYKLLLPEVFTLDAQDADQIHVQLEGLFKMLPAGTVIHQQNLFYTSTYVNKTHSDNYLINENLKKLNNADILRYYCNIYVTFSAQKQFKKSPTNNSLIRRFGLPFKQPYKDLLARKKEIEGTLINFENALGSISYFVVKKMKTADLNNAVYDYINQSYDTPTKDATKEVVNPISLSDQNDLMIGNKFVKVLSLIEEGEMLSTLETPKMSKILDSKIEMPHGIKSKCSMVYPIGLGLPFKHILNTIIEIQDSDAVQSALSGENRGLNFLANFYPPAKEKQKQLVAFSQELTEKDYQPCRTTVNVIICDENKDNLNKKVSLVQQGFMNMNHSTCYVENEENANLFFATIPGNAKANYRGFINISKQAICYLQKEGMYLSSDKGFIFHDRFGTPCVVDLWNNPSLMNRNRILIGPSGEGKSFLLNNFILQGYELKRDTIIIDIGGSYKLLTELNRGKYFDSNNVKAFQFNPFLCPRDRNGKYIYLDMEDEEGQEDLIDTIISVLSFIWKQGNELEPVEKAILSKSIKAFYEHVNKTGNIVPNLIEYSNFINTYDEQLDDFERRKIEFREINLLLEPYVTGELKFLLNAKENIDIVNDTLITFDMEAIKGKSYFPIVSILVLQLITDKIKKRQGVAKELYIDEALDFLKDEKFGNFIGFLYRTFRKKEGAITIGAQDVNFLKATPELIRRSIIINSDTKIILSHSKHQEALIDVKNMLSLSDKQIDMIRSIVKSKKWREFYMSLGDLSLIFRNGVSDVASVAFDSRQKTVVEIKNLFKETGFIPTAINQYIENHRSEFTEQEQEEQLSE